MASALKNPHPSKPDGQSATRKHYPRRGPILGSGPQRAVIPTAPTADACADAPTASCADLIRAPQAARFRDFVPLGVAGSSPAMAAFRSELWVESSDCWYYRTIPFRMDNSASARARSHAVRATALSRHPRVQPYRVHPSRYRSVTLTPRLGRRGGIGRQHRFQRRVRRASRRGFRHTAGDSAQNLCVLCDLCVESDAAATADLSVRYENSYLGPLRPYPLKRLSRVSKHRYCETLEHRVTFSPIPRALPTLGLSQSVTTMTGGGTVPGGFCCTIMGLALAVGARCKPMLGSIPWSARGQAFGQTSLNHEEPSWQKRQHEPYRSVRVVSSRSIPRMF